MGTYFLEIYYSKSGWGGGRGGGKTILIPTYNRNALNFEGTCHFCRFLFFIIQIKNTFDRSYHSLTPF